MAAKDPCIAVAIAVAFLAIIPAGDLLLLSQSQLRFLLSSPQGICCAVAIALLVVIPRPSHQRKAVKPHNRKTPRQSS
ncbi:hypothetical protein [Tunturiibacter gelidoferens]|jgi:hypothetical protein|uniref:Uncharacterized protein n=1 Tax=Tunturiibacter gelidiferens TaxID=3069689 RepID=A0A9X0QJ36_9BACT|nr:hypothetical protein [Edaphobacter lichenicola]MBB5331183.1 hypothetical protein [Edaphobacter lichenicola]